MNYLLIFLVGIVSGNLLIDREVSIAPGSYSLYTIYYSGTLEYSITDLTKSLIDVTVLDFDSFKTVGMQYYYPDLSCDRKTECILNSTKYNITVKDDYSSALLYIHNSNILSITTVRVIIKNEAPVLVLPTLGNDIFSFSTLISLMIGGGAALLILGVILYFRSLYRACNRKTEIISNTPPEMYRDTPLEPSRV